MKGTKENSPVDSKKDSIRQEIKKHKQLHTSHELYEKSCEIVSIVELLGIFQEAKNIFIYHAMTDEVQTLSLIERWMPQKKFFLPVVKDDRLVFREFTANTVLSKTKFGVLEPQGEDYTNYRQVDLIIVPGVAFDRKKNRLGYGKGYYDKFLPQINAPKLGICFEFQLLDAVPVDEYDIAMDYVVSENDIIW